MINLYVVWPLFYHHACMYIPTYKHINCMLLTNLGQVQFHSSPFTQTASLLGHLTFLPKALLNYAHTYACTYMYIHMYTYKRKAIYVGICKFMYTLQVLYNLHMFIHTYIWEGLMTKLNVLLVHQED